MKGYKTVFGFFALIFLFVSGCETAKGFKKDVENTWNNAKNIDEDFKENWW